MTENDKEKALKLIRGDYGEVVAKTTARYVEPIYWGQPKEQTLEITASGSIFFVNTGQRLFAVTAAHVVEGYKKSKQKTPDIRCYIGAGSSDDRRVTPLPFDPIDRLVDHDRRRDIATLHIERRELSRFGTTIIESWPPQVPKPSQAVALAGYPGHERQQIGENLWSFAPYPVLGLVSDVSGEKMLVYFDWNELFAPKGLEKPQPGYRLRGMSGGPVFTFHETSERIVTWRLGGIITSALESMDMLRAVSADCLQDDGTIHSLQEPRLYSSR